MKTTKTVLLVLCLLAMLATASPAMAEDTQGQESEEYGCTKIYLDDPTHPQVVASPSCLVDYVMSKIR